MSRGAPVPGVPVVPGGLLRVALEHVDVGVLLTDAQLRPVVVNGALRRMHGDHGPPPADGVWPGRPELREPDGRPLPPGPGLFERVLRERRLAGHVIGVLDVTTDRLHVVQVTGERLTDAAGAFLGLLLTVVDITDRLDLEEQLRDLAEHDELTGVLNRRGFTRRARLALDPSATAWLHVVDVDGLKSVNDRHGHAEGDRLLRVVAETLAEEAGVGGVVARTGGDEFAVLSDLADLAARVAARLPRAGARAGLLVEPSVSVGSAPVARYGEDLHDAMARADTAMYRLRALRAVHR